MYYCNINTPEYSLLDNSMIDLTYDILVLIASAVDLSGWFDSGVGLVS